MNTEVESRLLTLEDGLRVCRFVEKLIQPLGFHCALAGSLMYRGHSRKDIDVMIYPHDPHNAQPYQVALNALLRSGFTERIIAEESQTGSHKMNRTVAVFGFEDMRVDLFLM